MATYKIQHSFQKDNSLGNSSMLTIMGLKQFDEDSSPNTEMILIGMESSMESSEEIIKEIYRVLYNIIQTSDQPIVDGDIFILDPCTWEDYRDEKSYKIPKLVFKMVGFHLVLEVEKELDFSEEEETIEVEIAREITLDVACEYLAFIENNMISNSHKIRSSTRKMYQKSVDFCDFLKLTTQTKIEPIHIPTRHLYAFRVVQATVIKNQHGLSTNQAADIFAHLIEHDAINGNGYEGH